MNILHSIASQLGSSLLGQVPWALPSQEVSTMQQLEKDVGEILEELKTDENIVITKSKIRLWVFDKEGPGKKGRDGYVANFSGACELCGEITELRDFLRERNKPKEREWRPGDELILIGSQARYIIVGAEEPYPLQRVGEQGTNVVNEQHHWRNLTIEAEK